MRKTATRVVNQPIRKRTPHPKKVAITVKTPDEQLSEHLEKAEHHLIEAVKLFSGPRMVSRRVGYQKRLENAQEAITGLYREELVRIRGPLKQKRQK